MALIQPNMADVNTAAYTGTQYNIICSSDSPFTGTFGGETTTTDSTGYYKVTVPYGSTR